MVSLQICLKMLFSSIISLKFYIVKFYIAYLDVFIPNKNIVKLGNSWAYLVFDLLGMNNIQFMIKLCSEELYK